MDTLSKANRSRLMGKIKSRNTKLELMLFDQLIGLGFEYQPEGIYGHPDYGDRYRKIAIFIDGCFFHACPLHYKVPKTNTAYWLRKFANNRKRDIKVTDVLKREGWKVIRVWGHLIKKDPVVALELIRKEM